jgi:hypothetical protein
MNSLKLDAGQKHILRLVKRDADSEGWATVSKTLMPLIKRGTPEELLDIEYVGDTGAGRARLTTLGETIITAMTWL